MAGTALAVPAFRHGTKKTPAAHLMARGRMTSTAQTGKQDAQGQG